MDRWRLIFNRAITITALFFTIPLVATASDVGLTVGVNGPDFKSCSQQQNYWGCPDSLSSSYPNPLTITIQAVNSTFYNVQLVSAVTNFLEGYFFYDTGDPRSCPTLANGQNCSLTLQTAMNSYSTSQSSVIYVKASISQGGPLITLNQFQLTNVAT